jgi:hypothetical protein
MVTVYMNDVMINFDDCLYYGCYFVYFISVFVFWFYEFNHICLLMDDFNFFEEYLYNPFMNNIIIFKNVCLKYYMDWNI